MSSQVKKGYRLMKYVCNRCYEKWDFIPSDYKYNKKAYPTRCPLCSMPISQMIKEVFEVEGFIAVIKRLIKRFL